MSLSTLSSRAIIVDSARDNVALAVQALVAARHRHVGNETGSPVARHRIVDARHSRLSIWPMRQDIAAYATRLMGPQ